MGLWGFGLSFLQLNPLHGNLGFPHTWQNKVPFKVTCFSRWSCNLWGRVLFCAQGSGTQWREIPLDFAPSHFLRVIKAISSANGVGSSLRPRYISDSVDPLAPEVLYFASPFVSVSCDHQVSGPKFGVWISFVVSQLPLGGLLAQTLPCFVTTFRRLRWLSSLSAGITACHTTLPSPRKRSSGRWGFLPNIR